MSNDGDVAKRRVGLMVVASWALATVITGLVVWRAVAVLDDGTRTEVLSGAQVSGLLASETATPGTTTTPAAAVTIPAASTEPPTAAVTSAPPATAGTTAPAATKTASSSYKPPAPPATPVVRNWTVEAGSVSASCTGQTISLLSASPADGWRVKIESRGPDRVKVEFVSGERETSVSGTCVAGVPQQSTSEHD
jgi:hypothetical protein